MKKENNIKKTDLRDVLSLVKDKLARDPNAACGVLWTDDPQPTTKYAIGEEDGGSGGGITTRYAVGEED